MADLHHLISLGVGTPADVPHFLLVGLSPTAGVGAGPPLRMLMGLGTCWAALMVRLCRLVG